MKLHFDFETRSRTDLKVEGLDNYCADPSTEVMCMSYAFGDNPVMLWHEFSTRFPLELVEHIRQGRLLSAHNAQFEFEVWNRVLRRRFPELPLLDLRQMRCTMAKAYAMRLPGKLENALVATGCAERKDADGHRVMLQLSRPRKVLPDGTVTWWTREEHPDKYEKLYRYCEQDTESERELDHILVDLSPEEQEVWVMDQEINRRGVAFDRGAVVAADRLAESEKRRLDEEMRSLTSGFVGTCDSHAALRQWLLMAGVETESVDKDSVLRLLKRSDLPSGVRAALTTRQEAAKSSTAKLDTMLKRASTDDRLRFIFQYHGAGTGRWSGRGVQLHNLVRPKIKPGDVEWIIEQLNTNDSAKAAAAVRLFYGNPLDQIPNCLRGMLVAAPGHDLLAGDYANIEGRVTAWVAGEQWKLQAFRDFDAGIGPDIYRMTYSACFDVPIEQVTKSGEDRQLGKVIELSTGYQGWTGAMSTMCKTYNVSMTDEQKVDACSRARKAQPAICATWPALEQAAIRAVASEGERVRVQMPTSPCVVTFCRVGNFLWLQLPSGRALCYPYPEIYTNVREFTRDDGSTFTREAPAVRYLGEDSVTKQWDWQETYGGLWLENIVQAIARDLLVNAMLHIRALGYNIVLHVHDEAVIEAEKDCPLSVREYCDMLAEMPNWAAGLPISVDGWRKCRYQKS